MAGPNYEKQIQEWETFVGYFQRGLVGEAGIELLEAVERRRSEQQQRWKATVKEYPHAITGVDPGELLGCSVEKSRLFDSFVSNSHEWLRREFAGREDEVWEEMAQIGCYWVRFKHKSDLEKYKQAFSEQLIAFEFKEPASE
jgi:hypothetical protein